MRDFGEATLTNGRVEITLEHWFYLYIPWFLPGLLLAMAVSSSPREPDAREA